MTRLFSSILALGLFTAAASPTPAHAQIQVRIGSGGYQNGYGPRYYGGYRPNYYGGYGQRNYGVYGPRYNQNHQSFIGGYGPNNNRYPIYGAGPYGNPTYFYGQPYGTAYNPGGVGVYSNFNDGW